MEDELGFLIDYGHKLIKRAEGKAVDWVEVRIENTRYEYIQYLNDRVKEANINRYIGVGIRVGIGNSIGFSSTSSHNGARMEEALDEAIKIAKLSNNQITLSTEESRNKRYELKNYRHHPKDISFEEKLDAIKKIYESIFEASPRKDMATVKTPDLEISLASVSYGAYYGDIIVMTNEGIEVSSHQILTGIRTTVIVEEAGKRGDGTTYLGTSRGMDKLLEEDNLVKLGVEAAQYALEKAGASFAPAGYQVVVAAPGISGVFAHESFGHMSEGDFALSKSTPLYDKVGEILGAEYVSIYDSGYPPYENSFYYPVDSEGVETRTVTLVEKGVFKGFMHSRETAAAYGISSTGNGRAEDYSHPQIVRMRNTYFGPGDWKYEEVIKETKYGILVDDERGGQANLDGTFTFTASRGYIIKNGEIIETVRDIILTGNILEMLKHVDAATDKVEILTLPFGGCGKDGQSVYIGLGGPYLRISKLQIGGK